MTPIDQKLPAGDAEGEPGGPKAPFPIVIFADGACSGNPGPGGWGTVVAMPDGTVLEVGGEERPSTNNRMELMAVIRGLEAVRDVKAEAAVHTDSTYVIRGITQWIFAWRQRGWKTAEGNDVTNRDLWERLFAAVMQRKDLGAEGKISWHYVRGHTGIAGNERVDEIAQAFSKGTKVSLYRGPLLGYSVAIHDIPDNTALPPMRDREEKKKGAFSYLSYVDGKVERHATWPECERRVKGRSGAKFKKAASESDEAVILKGWGVK